MLRGLADEPAARPSDDRCLHAAAASWPGLVVPGEVFAQWVGERIAASAIATTDPARLADLYLACACALGVVGAADRFRDTYAPELAQRLRSSDASGVDGADLLQIVLERVLVRDGESPPRIAEYRGGGSLRAWLRVVAFRVRINARRNTGDHVDPLPDRFDAALADELDPELEYLKAHYRAAFRTALGEALEKLSARERNLLRMHAIHGLSATGVAAVFHVHRATAKRWLADVRDTVLEATRARLMASLEIDTSELDSVMRLIASRLEASVRRHLDGDDAAEPGERDGDGDDP